MNFFNGQQSPNYLYGWSVYEKSILLSLKTTISSPK